MAVNVRDVRSELQMPDSLISDDDVEYAIQKVTENDVNLVCAQVVRMLKRKYRGRVRYRIGRYVETIDAKALDNMIRDFMTKSSLTQVESGVDPADIEPIFDEDSP